MRVVTRKLSEVVGSVRYTGCGTTAVVFAGHLVDTPTKRVAVKVFDDNRDFNEELAWYQSVCSACPGVAVPPIMGMYDSVSQKFAIIMEYVHVLRCVDHFSCVEQIQTLGRHLLRSLSLLEERGWQHCDIKPENLGLGVESDMKTVKIMDWGAARTNTQLQEHVMVSLRYRPPELLLRTDPYVHARTRIDVWALGCVLVGMYIGRDLFCGDDVVDVLTRIIRVLGAPPHTMVESSLPACSSCVAGTACSWCGPTTFRAFTDTKCSRGLQTWIENKDMLHALTSMLTVDPNTRPSARECLSLPFFSSEEHSRKRALG